MGVTYRAPALDAPANTPYRLDGVSLTFSQDILKRSEGKFRVVAIEITSKTQYSKNGRVTPTVLRLARCVVPDDDEAVSTLRESLALFEDDDSVWEGVPSYSPGGIEARTVSTLSRSSSMLTSSCEVVQIVHYTESCVPSRPDIPCTTTSHTHQYVLCTSNSGGSYNPPTYDPPPGGGSFNPGPDVCDDDQLMTPAEGEELCGPSSLENDIIPLGEDPPDCTEPQTDQWAIDYCARRPPTPAERGYLEAAISNIDSRGGVCNGMADDARSLLASGDLQLYPRTANSQGGYGSPDLGVYLEEGWIAWHTGVHTMIDDAGNTLERNLEQALVHELDHYRGIYSHTDVNAGAFRTTNSALCSGLTHGRVAWL